MATKSESPIKEKDSYCVLRHKATGLYIHELDYDEGNYELEEYTDHQLYFGPTRIYPSVGGWPVRALEIPPGTESGIARRLDKEVGRVIDWLNQNPHYATGYVPKCNYEYSDFELLLVEVEYSVKDTKPVAAIV